MFAILSSPTLMKSAQSKWEAGVPTAPSSFSRIAAYRADIDAKERAFPTRLCGLGTAERGHQREGAGRGLSCGKERCSERMSAKGSEGLIRSNGEPRGGTSCGPEGWTSQGGAAGARTHEGAATDMVTAPCVLKKKSPGVGLLSHELPRSIIGDGGLNFRVRNGIGCTPSSMDARTDSLVTVREGWLCSRRHFARDRNRIK